MGRKKLKKPSVNRVGQKFGLWKLISVHSVKRYVAKGGKNKGKMTTVWYYLCECECGNKSAVSFPDLLQGKSTRCKKCALKLYLVNSQKGIKRFGKDNPNYRGSKDVPQTWFGRAKRNASSRDFIFKITIEDLQNQWVKQKGLCFYTGLPLNFSNGEVVSDTNNHISLIASLDRTDSSKGYIVDNITWVSKTINKLKMDLPHDLFLLLCETVFKYNKGKIYEPVGR